MAFETYKLIKVTVQGKVAYATINSPPVNVKPLADGLRDESYLFQQLVRTESGRNNMQKFLEIGGQTREGELKIQELNGLLGKF
jgi:hypothetical protein